MVKSYRIDNWAIIVITQLSMVKSQLHIAKTKGDYKLQFTTNGLI